jgi:hypothetical protein
MHKRRRSTHYKVAAAPHLHYVPFAERRPSLPAMKREPAGEVTNRARPHTLSRRRSAAQAALGLPCEATLFAVMPETDHRLTRVVLSRLPGALKASLPAPYAGPAASVHAIAEYLRRGHVTTNFAEPNVQSDPGPGPSAGSFTPRPRRIGAAVTTAEPTWRHVMSAENSGRQLL